MIGRYYGTSHKKTRITLEKHEKCRMQIFKNAFRIKHYSAYQFHIHLHVESKTMFTLTNRVEILYRECISRLGQLDTFTELSDNSYPVLLYYYIFKITIH